MRSEEDGGIQAAIFPIAKHAETNVERATRDRESLEFAARRPSFVKREI
jgi:hypothetical protein